ERRAHGRLERPVILWILALGYRRPRPGDALIDPSAEQADLLGGERLALLRHLQLRVHVGDGLDEHTLRALAGHDRVRAVGIAPLQRRLLLLQAQGRLLLLRPVTGIT